MRSDRCKKKQGTIEITRQKTINYPPKKGEIMATSVTYCKRVKICNDCKNEVTTPASSQL